MQATFLFCLRYVDFPGSPNLSGLNNSYQDAKKYSDYNNPISRFRFIYGLFKEIVHSGITAHQGAYL